MFVTLQTVGPRCFLSAAVKFNQNKQTSSRKSTRLIPDLYAGQGQIVHKSWVNCLCNTAHLDLFRLAFALQLISHRLLASSTMNHPSIEVN